jgi:hypothetical protein
MLLQLSHSTNGASLIIETPSRKQYVCHEGDVWQVLSDILADTSEPDAVVEPGLGQVDDGERVAMSVLGLLRRLSKDDSSPA